MIPRIFHVVWLGDKPMPPHIHSWMRHHPAWRLRVWTEHNRPSLQNEAIFQQARSLSEKSDVLRYEVLHLFGGVYVDADFECLRSIEPLLDGVDCFAAIQNAATISTALLGSEPGHKVIRTAIEEMPTGFPRSDDANSNSGPGWFTEMLHRRGLRDAIAVFPQQWFYPLAYDDRDHPPADFQRAFPEAYAVHLWMHSWGRPLPRRDVPSQIEEQKRAKLLRELASFQETWQGGYFNDIDHDQERNLSAVVDRCIRGRIAGKTVLEIGPGRGAWTKRILDEAPRRVYCLDALSAEHNHFWEYLGDKARELVEYHQATDFECTSVPDNSIDYLFSFDAFCHISLSGTERYLDRLRAKLRPGAECFIMYADAKKFLAIAGWNGWIQPGDGETRESYDGEPAPQRWYWLGVERFCAILEQYGYEILSRDVDVVARDPICHFRRRSQTHVPAHTAREIAEQPKPILSVCVSLKNRSRVAWEGQEINLFPQCVESLGQAARGLADLGQVELVVADFQSTDWLLEEWLTKYAAGLQTRIIALHGSFSRGRGLNEAARHASSDRLFLCDADILFGEESLRRAIEVIDSGCAWLPIFHCLDQAGAPDFWQDYGYGLVGVSPKLLESAGGVPEFDSWGGEDDLLHEALAQRVEVVRERRADLQHQWHPDALRDVHYTQPRGSDYARVTAAPDSRHPSHRFWGEHCDWRGEVWFFPDGRMERLGADTGEYRFVEQERIVLNWDRWPSEVLRWDEGRSVYTSSEKRFTLQPQFPTPHLNNENNQKLELPSGNSEDVPASTTSPLRPAELVALQDLADIAQMLDNLAVRWSLQGGNVLSYHRHGGFLVNECDVDIAILAEDWSDAVDQAAQSLGFRSWIHHQGIGDNGMHVCWRRAAGAWPIEIYPTSEGCFFGQRLRYNGGDRYWRYYFPPRYLEETRQVDFLGVQVRIPADTEGYLRWLYGDGFATPLGDDKWDWVKEPGARSWNFLRRMECAFNSAVMDFNPIENAGSDRRLTRIYVDGVFDLFHWGHVEIFRSARALAPRPHLIVGVAADQDIDYKQTPTLTFDERLRMVAACRMVDETVLAPKIATAEFLDHMNVDLVVHGDDVTDEHRQLWYGDAIRRGIYREVPYSRTVSSHDIKARIRMASSLDSHDFGNKDKHTMSIPEWETPHQQETDQARDDSCEAARIDLLSSSETVRVQSNYFSRAVCINLARRSDRWESFQRQVEKIDWPFVELERFNAIDGRRVPPPKWFDTGDAAGAWGCLASHLRVWEDAINDDIENVLIFEDDAAFCEGFVGKVMQFIKHVPSNWDQLWLGGDHAPSTTPVRINEFVYRPEAAHRMHCYAMSRNFLKAAYHHVTAFNRPGRFRDGADYHIDHQLWDLTSDRRFQVFCPQEWLVGQKSDVSDIVGFVRHFETTFYNDVNPIQQGRFST